MSAIKMKNTLLIGMMAVFTATGFAQNPDKAIARIKYTFKHQRNTDEPQNIHTENMLLVVGKNASVYTSYDKINSTIAFQNMIQEQMKSPGKTGSMGFLSTTMTVSTRGGTGTNEGMGMQALSTTDYYFFARENRFFSKERVMNNYLVEESPTQINWKLSADTISFSGIHCQKATVYFKGRNWIAWYAPELPFHTGPWKLNSLPGLILEAYDEKKQVQFLFAGLENIQNKGFNEVNKFPENTEFGPGGNMRFMDNNEAYLGQDIKIPNNTIKTSRKELEYLKKVLETDPQGFIRTQAGGEGIMMTAGTAVPTSGSVTFKPQVENNPIELPEKK